MALVVGVGVYLVVVVVVVFVIVGVSVLQSDIGQYDRSVPSDSKDTTHCC